MGEVIFELGLFLAAFLPFVIMALSRETKLRRLATVVAAVMLTGLFVMKEGWWLFDYLALAGLVLFVCRSWFGPAWYTLGGTLPWERSSLWVPREVQKAVDVGDSDEFGPVKKKRDKRKRHLDW